MEKYITKIKNNDGKMKSFSNISINDIEKQLC